MLGVHVDASLQRAAQRNTFSQQSAAADGPHIGPRLSLIR